METIKEYMKHYMTQGDFKQKYNLLIQETLSHPQVQKFLKEHQEAVTPDIIKNSYAKLYEFVQETKRVEQEGYSQNKGFIPELVLNVGYIDVLYKATEDTIQQEKQRELESRVQTVEMPKGIKQATLKSFDITAGRVEPLEYCIDFCEQYVTKGHYIKGAYLYGSYGVGKTYLLGAVANELAKSGVKSYVAHFPSLVVELKAAISNNTIQEKLENIKRTEILFLDDIGGESLTPWVRDDVLMTVLDYRMREQLPTFFTSNLTFDLLEEHFKGVTVGDERKAKRLMERVKYLSKPLSITGENRRV